MRIFIIIRIDKRKKKTAASQSLIAFESEADAKMETERLYNTEKNKDDIEFFVDEVDFVQKGLN